MWGPLVPLDYWRLSRFQCATTESCLRSKYIWVQSCKNRSVQMRLIVVMRLLFLSWLPCEVGKYRCLERSFAESAVTVVPSSAAVSLNNVRFSAYLFLGHAWCTPSFLSKYKVVNLSNFLFVCSFSAVYPVSYLPNTFPIHRPKIHTLLQWVKKRGNEDSSCVGLGLFRSCRTSKGTSNLNYRVWRLSAASWSCSTIYQRANDCPQMCHPEGQTRRVQIRQ